MKIKAIAKLCKDTEYIALIDIMNEAGCYEQWLGSGGALYKIVGLPYLNRENVFTIFEIPKEKQECYAFVHEEGIGSFNLENTDETEDEVARLNITFTARGQDIRPTSTNRGMSFYNTEYLAPLADMKDITIHERITTQRKKYFAVKQGFLILGIFMSYEDIDENLVEILSLTAKGAEKICRANQLEKEQIQMSMKTER